MTKVIEYLRVSTKEQGCDDRVSIPGQKETNTRTIEKNKLNPIEEIKLIDVSGTSILHTPEVNRLLELIKSNEIKGIVVSDWDRLMRLDDFRDFALFQFIKESGTLIYLPDQIVDLNTQSGFMTGGINVIMCGNELTKFKKCMLRAKEIKRKKGEHPNSLITLPYGVTYDYEKKNFFYTKDIYRVKELFFYFTFKVSIISPN